MSRNWWIAFGLIAVKVYIVIIIALLVARHIIKKNILKDKESRV